MNPDRTSGTTLDEVTLGELRRELRHLVALAHTGELPRPTVVNGPDHEMPGHEWQVEQRTVPGYRKPPTWYVRTVDEPETTDAVYVCPPDLSRPAEDFTAMPTDSARQLAMAILAACDRADHQALKIIRLTDRRKK